MRHSGACACIEPGRNGQLLTSIAAQAAMQGMPGYCGDRYYKAYAGAERICEKFERRSQR